MTTPKSFKKSNKDKKIRACKKGIASEAIGILEKNTDTFILTYGQFSLIDALVSILDQTGPAHVVTSTWSTGHYELGRLHELVIDLDIKSLKMIIDRSYKTVKPENFYHMMHLFDINSIRQIRVHSKFIIIRNDNWNIVVKTSMNLNKNPRLENIEVSENKDFADFFEQIVDDIFKEVLPGESKSDLPGLKSIEENSLFKTISAKSIKRNTLNDPKYTHTID